MIFPLIAIPFGRIQLYQKPISMRFGERKLTISWRAAGLPGMTSKTAAYHCS